MAGECAMAATALRALRARLPEAARVYVAGCAGEPLAAASLMAEEPSLAAGLTFVGVWIPGVNTIDYAALHPTSASELVFLAPEFRASFEARRATLRPLTYTQAFARFVAEPVDAAIIHTSAPDPRGRVSLGVSADFSPALMARPGVFKLALVNPHMPAPALAPDYPLEMFDLVAAAPHPLLRYAPAAPGAAFRSIADHVARLVGDGDTLQMGLGNVQVALPPALAGKRRLAIHSGMAGDALVDAIDAGVIADHAGAVTLGVALGTPRLYERAARDGRFRFAPVSHTHAIGTLSAIDNFVAVNSVIEVDLFGQANAEYIGGRQVSGGGGLADFLRGAAASKGGRPIVALAATAHGGKVSRIAPRLDTPSTTLARTDVAIVITEYGVADLRGMSLDERAGALIAIAHPDHRRALAAAWDQQSREV